MNYTYDTTIEDLVEGVGLDVEIEYKTYPGEPMVRYYPDGSGYPGSPPYAEIQRVRVLAVVTENFEAVRNQKPSPYWKLFDVLAEDYVFQRQGDYEEEIMDHHASHVGEW
jgi:hypothetical protein